MVLQGGGRGEWIGITANQQVNTRKFGMSIGGKIKTKRKETMFLKHSKIPKINVGPQMRQHILLYAT